MSEQPLYEDPRDQAEIEFERGEDARCVIDFCEEMRFKMYRSSLDKGRHGWRGMSPDVLADMMLEHVAKGDMIDVANFAMMLWWHDQQKALAAAKDAGR